MSVEQVRARSVSLRKLLRNDQFYWGGPLHVFVFVGWSIMEGWQEWLALAGTTMVLSVAGSMLFTWAELRVIGKDGPDVSLSWFAAGLLVVPVAMTSMFVGWGLVSLFS